MQPEDLGENRNEFSELWFLSQFFTPISPPSFRQLHTHMPEFEPYVTTTNLKPEAKREE